MNDLDQPITRMQQPETPQTEVADSGGVSNNQTVNEVRGEPGMAQAKSSVVSMLMTALVVVAAGIGTGYVLSQFTPTAGKQAASAQPAPVNSDEVKVGAVYGSQDPKAFPDEVTGVLIKGGIDGEGSHHLLRPGGKSQNVYLTSSVIDLDIVANHKVKVNGETFAAQNAGWLMDVGRVEVLELNAEKPFEE